LHKVSSAQVEVFRAKPVQTVFKKEGRQAIHKRACFRINAGQGITLAHRR